MSTLTPFHLAIPVRNLDSSRRFYRDVLGCREGRSSDKWVDFDLFGHQFVIHEVEGHKIKKTQNSNPVDGQNVPVPHFGVVLEWNHWQALFDRLEKNGIDFVIEPYIRFKGETGEQATMFFLDPEGNALEFKSFRNMDQLFVT
jgi:uncharacterized protein